MKCIVIGVVDVPQINDLLDLGKNDEQRRIAVMPISSEFAGDEEALVSYMETRGMSFFKNTLK